MRSANDCGRDPRRGSREPRACWDSRPEKAHDPRRSLRDAACWALSAARPRANPRRRRRAVPPLGRAESDARGCARLGESAGRHVDVHCQLQQADHAPIGPLDSDEGARLPLRRSTCSSIHPPRRARSRPGSTRDEFAVRMSGPSKRGAALVRSRAGCVTAATTRSSPSVMTVASAVRARSEATNTPVSMISRRATSVHRGGRNPAPRGRRPRSLRRAGWPPAARGRRRRCWSRLGRWSRCVGRPW